MVEKFKYTHRPLQEVYTDMVLADESDNSTVLYAYDKEHNTYGSRIFSGGMSATILIKSENDKLTLYYFDDLDEDFSVSYNDSCEDSEYVGHIYNHILEHITEKNFL